MDEWGARSRIRRSFALLVGVLTGYTLPILALRPTAPREGSLASAGVLAAVGAQAAQLETAAPQVRGLTARHRKGQTILTWNEAIPVFGDADPTVERVVQAKKQFEERSKVTYRIYRSDRPISSLEGLTPLAEIPPLTGWDLEFYGIAPKATDKALRYVVEDGGQPVPPGTGIYAINAPRSRDSYYAVTTVVNGRENNTLSDANLTRQAVHEVAGIGEPILQRVRKPASFGYIDNPTLEYYVRWEAPPNSSIPSRPFDYVVALPPNMKKPAPAGIHMHCYGGNLESCFGWWFNGELGAVYIASNELPYDWWTGYPDRWETARPLATKEDWQQSVVHPYTQTRMLSFLEWAAAKYDLDVSRTFTAGISMGGSGALMMAIRYPEKIAWAVSWVGVHRPLGTPTFKNSYQHVYGDPAWNVRFEDGSPVWDYFDDVKYLRSHVGQDVGFLTFANGKNDTDIGWPQAVEFYRALQETHQPHLFVWGQNGHGERARMPVTAEERNMRLDVRVNQTLLAFTRSSLDDDPGDGAVTTGAPSGQSNLYLMWDTRSIRDEPDAMEITVGVTENSPKGEGTADVTPRRVQKFKTMAGERVLWTNTPNDRVTPIQSGEVVTDQWGLVTLPHVTVTKGGNRLRIVRSPR